MKEKKEVGLGFVTSVLLLEALHTACGIDNLLFPRKEGVTSGTNFNADLSSSRGTGLNHVSTRATKNGLSVFGMDTFLHIIL
jgi:hypothetical protein